MDTGRRRVSIREAAKILDVSESAIHKRVQRGTLAHDKGPDGRVFVYLDVLSDAVPDGVHHPSTEALISEMRDRIGFLERELAVRSDEIRRRDHIIAGLVERVPELPPASPQEPRDGRETVSADPAGEEVRGDNGGPQEGVQRRPWWRRMFAG